MPAGIGTAEFRETAPPPAPATTVAVILPGEMVLSLTQSPLTTLVAAGVLSRNEARSMLGH